MMSVIVLFLTLLVAPALSCNRPGGPVPQKSLDNFVKNVVQSLLPAHLPDWSLVMKDVIKLDVTEVTIVSAGFNSAGVSLPQPNHLVVKANGLEASLHLRYTIVESSGKHLRGSAILGVSGTELSITNDITPSSFRVTDASFHIRDLTLKATDQPAIEPYWKLIRPVIIEVIETAVPTFLKRALSTHEIRVLVLPIIHSLEPIRLPDVNQTLLGITGSFTHATIGKIDFTEATLERGANDDEVALALTGVTAFAQNRWEFKDSILGIDKNGTGSIDILGTSVQITIGLGKTANGSLTVNLDSSSLVIGPLNITLHGTVDDKVLNWLVAALEPLVALAIQNTFQAVLCLLFDFS